MPLFFAVAEWGVRSNRLPPLIFKLLVGLALLQLVNLAIAYGTGFQDKFLSTASAEILERHERLGQIFSLAWLLLTVALVFHARRRNVVTLILCTVLLLIQIVVGIQLGHLGGELMNPAP